MGNHSEKPKPEYEFINPNSAEQMEQKLRELCVRMLLSQKSARGGAIDYPGLTW